MTQSRIMSLVEAATNVIVGYALAVGMQIVVFPVFGIHIALGDQLAIGLAFTGVSLVRGYMLRRLFEKRQKSRVCPDQSDLNILQPGRFRAKQKEESFGGVKQW
jgi:hypothetical protein